MDSSGAGVFKIEKLGESNYHVWKQKVELLLAFRELGNHISVNAQPEKLEPEWLKTDSKAKAVIGLTLSDEHLEHVRECKTAADMWKVIADLFQRRTLLNRLTTRRKFYTAKMDDNERVVSYISRVRQLAADLKSMDTDVEDQEIAMTVLCGLSSKFENLIVAIDAVTDENKLTLEFVKSRLLQEEQRISDRSPGSISADSALVNNTIDRNIRVCSYCKKPVHLEPRCWQKYPHLHPTRKNKGMVADLSRRGKTPEKQESDDDDFICLVGNHTKSGSLDFLDYRLWCHSTHVF